MILFILSLVGIGIILGVLRLGVICKTNGYIQTIAETRYEPAAIVFGAGLLRNGTPTRVLKDRVETAVELYRQGKTGKLLMSGDNSRADYNEPLAMKNYAISLGVPETDIVTDPAGVRTYDTCYRAKNIFKLDQVILVTQRFHLSRALFICQSIGMNSFGVPADKWNYRMSSYILWQIREIPATFFAIWESWLGFPPPLIGPAEPIFPSEEE